MTDLVKTEMNKLSNQSAIIHELFSYNGNIDIDSFLRISLNSSTEYLENIYNERAIKLNVEISNNLMDAGLIANNSDALEKRFSKPRGRFLNNIFNENITISEYILKLLKTNTLIAL